MKLLAWRSWSLRTKLVTACVLVELVAAALVLSSSTSLLQQALREQATAQAMQALALLDQAVAAPLAQRDYATAQQTLDMVRKSGSIRYVVLFDHRDKQVAASGWDARLPLPRRDTGEVDLDRADTTLHLSAPIVVGGQRLGKLDLGLPTERLRQARSDYLQRILLISFLALLLSIALLAAIAVAVTRHLRALSQASRRLAAGDFNAAVQVHGEDEISQLGASFNSMAAMIKQRMLALEESEQRQGQHLRKARDEQARLTSLLGAMRSGILLVDARQRVVYTNEAFAHIWGLPTVPTGRAMAELVPLLMMQAEPDDAGHLHAMLGAGPEPPGDVEFNTLDGRIISQRMQPVAAGTDSSGGCIWFHHDVTLERQTQQRAWQALRDPLTKLMNRRGLYETLQAAIAAAARNHSSVALMFVDLDDFKHANDLGGHRTGDEILVAVGRALSGQLRRGETVARLGGDEFAVLSPGVTAAEAAAIAARLVGAVSRLRFQVGPQALHVGCSVGLARYPDDALNDEDLIACADTAMYQAKQSGKNDWAAYRSDTARSLAESDRVNWNDRIHGALQDRRLRLQFQAVYRADDRQVAFYEALVRMLDDEDVPRLIPPSQFIPHAERSGKIRQIDRWVFQTCVEQLALTEPGVRIAANLSARTLDDPSFPDFLRSALQLSGVDPARLHIELTETSALGDPVSVRPQIKALRDLGCAVHLDDFGSGFSSFAHLRLLEVDGIKIDGSFIRNLAHDKTNELVVASLVKIAHSLGKITVAECVEDEATLQILRVLEVDLVQGFHLARPSSHVFAPNQRTLRRPAVELDRAARPH